jgi:hypothetical protein
MSLDEFVEDYGFSPPDLVKLDVEGAEASVLEGARLTLERHRPVVFVALHGREQATRCLRLLEQLQYECRSLDGRRVAQGDGVDEIYAVPEEATGGSC